MSKWNWPLVGVVITAGILYVGYFAHSQFRNAIIEAFDEQQTLFASSIEFAIQDHLLEEEQDLRNAIRTLGASGHSINGTREIFTNLYATHLDDFTSVSIHDDRGKVLEWISSGTTPDPAIIAHLEKTVTRVGSLFRAFLSESLFSADAGPFVYLFVPFRVIDREELYYAAAGIYLTGYLVSHFPAWRGRRMGFVLSDDDGDILALLNTSHELDLVMLPGNIFSLADKCLECHQPRDFQDVYRAVQQERVVHWRYKNPGDDIDRNRLTKPFKVMNEKWAITVLSPFESIQRAISRNLVVSLGLTTLALCLVGLVSFFFLKASSYEKLATAATALQRSEETLRAYSRRLEEANRLKDLFTDIVRHDLMSAVSAVKGYASLLSEGEQDNSRKQVFSAMDGSLAKLRDLIECSATISKLEEGSIETEPLDVSDALRRSLERISSAALEKNITFNTDMPDTFFFETSPLIEEAFVNLLSNAVKYSPREGQVDIRLQDTDLGLVFSVKDRGEGISDQHKDRVFERLERLDKSGIKGSGLGLAIVKRVVTLHNGNVSVTDNPEGGAVFTIRIPPGRGDQALPRSTRGGPARESDT